MKRFFLFRPLVWFLVMWAMGGFSPAPVWAVPAHSVSLHETSRAEKIDRIMEALSRPEAKVHLAAAGFNAGSVRSRLESLGDAELARIADRAESVRAAGDAGVAIAILVIVLIIVIWLYAANKKIAVTDRDK